MKTIQSLIISCFLIGSVNTKAQYDFRFMGSEQKNYSSITNPDEEVDINSAVTYLDLGFNMESYGFTVNKIMTANGHLSIRFNNHAYLDIWPMDNFYDPPKAGRGKLLVKRNNTDPEKYVLFEFQNLESTNGPDETYSYQVKIFQNGKILFHYGPNTLSENHLLRKGYGHVVVFEDDYIVQSQNPGNESYRSAVLIYGDPISPSVSESYDTLYIKDFPPNGMLYTISPAALTGVNELTTASGVLISPNPVKELLNIEWKNNSFNGVEISDMGGRVLLSKRYDEFGNRAQLSLKGFSSGVYQVALLRNNRKTMIQSFVIE